MVKLISDYHGIVLSLIEYKKKLQFRTLFLVKVITCYICEKSQNVHFLTLI